MAQREAYVSLALIGVLKQLYKHPIVIDRHDGIWWDCNNSMRGVSLYDVVEVFCPLERGKMRSEQFHYPIVRLWQFFFFYPQREAVTDHFFRDVSIIKDDCVRP